MDENIQNNEDLGNSQEVNKTVNFKRPIFVGKIGKIPKKIQNAPSKEKSSSCTSEKEIENISTDNSDFLLKKEIEENDSDKLSLNKETVDNSLSVPYQEPSWSSTPITSDIDYKFEVLKSGVIKDNINLMSKNFWVFGRLPSCDICLTHPTISRFHAVLQYNGIESENRPIGFYIYDLGSTHGTFLNKNQIKSKMYVRMQVGHMIKFGNSTRHYILQGPESDTEPESELSVMELKSIRTEILKNSILEKEKEALLSREEAEKEQGIDWGMGEDADEETDLTENPYAATNNEELYLDDPKKTLRGFFEREGCNLEYDVEEKGIGQFLCRVELPVDNSIGKPIVAEVLHKGKKKEAVIQCALEACRLLDRIGVLRQANQESRKRKIKNWEEDDFYDSDDDEFLDRTGAIQKKRERRMKMHGKIVQQVPETYNSLKTKEEELLKVIFSKEKELSDASRLLPIESTPAKSDDVDPLDAFMNNLSTSASNKHTIRNLRSQLTKLKQEHLALKKLIDVAQPTKLPPLVNSQSSSNQKESLKQKLPIIGKKLKINSIKIGQSKVIEETQTSEQENDEYPDSKNIFFDSNDKGTTQKLNINDISSKTSVEVTDADQTNSKHLIGPTIPENVDELLNKNIKHQSNSDEKSRKRNQRKTVLREKRKLKYITENQDNYSMWLPPEDQEGDGKTKLNEKFGY